MPLYEYQCSNCRERFEVLQRIGDGAESVRCPECGAERVERQLSTFAAASSSSSPMANVGAGCGSGACGTGFT